MGLTAFLPPSLLSGLTDVSVSPGSGQSDYPLVWDNTLGKWVASPLQISILTGGPLPLAQGGTGATIASDARSNLGLGSIATQAAGSVAITGGSLSNLSVLNMLGNASNTRLNLYTHSSALFNHSSQFLGYRSRGSSSSIQGVNSGDWLFFLGGVPRGSTGWSNFGTGFIVIANQNSSAAATNLVHCKLEFLGVNASGVGSTWMTHDGATMTLPVATPSTSTTSGALTVSGGVGVVGAIYNGGNLVSSGAKINFVNLPTTDVGLAVGDLWRDGNIVKVKI